MNQQAYTPPLAETTELLHLHSLLASLSMSAGFDDWEYGDGPTEEFELGDEV